MDKQSLTRLQRQLTGKYVATNGLFWMAYVCIWGFGAVYLKGKGFSSTETGIITALLAQGLSAYDAARAGAYLHARAGLRAEKKFGAASMTAWDISECVRLEGCGID